MKLHLYKLTWLSLIIVAIAVLCIDAPAKSFACSSDSNPNGVPVVSLFPFFQTISYSPEYDLKTDSLVIPLKRAGRLLLIEATVDNEQGNLVFDTGASGLVFNSTYFRNHVRSNGENSNGITGGVGSVEQIAIEKLEFAGLSYKNIRADLANLGHIENRRGVKILGLIGFNMIRNFEIWIDVKNNQLKLFRIDRNGNRITSGLSNFRPDHTQKISNSTNILFIEGRIGGKSLNFCFDTGAETNVISSYSNKNILNTLTITRRSGLRGTGSAKAEVLFGRMNDFSLGNRQITGMETIVSNLDALGEVYGTKIDGMLGYNFMEQGILCINFTKKQFSILYTKGEEK
jgi:predicted aspartyl protease